jgi:hypothetical protein
MQISLILFPNAPDNISALVFESKCQRAMLEAELRFGTGSGGRIE